MRNRAPDSLEKLKEELRGENTGAVLDRFEAAMKREEIDPEEIQACLDILDEKAPLDMPIPDAKEELARFEERYADVLASKKFGSEAPHRTRRTHRVLRAAVAACLCIVLVGAVAQACGLDIIGHILEWREDTFVLRGSNHGGQMVLDDAPEGEFTSLADAVAAYGITDPVAPTWIPEGMAVQYVRTKDLDHAIDLTARYVGDNDRKVIVKVYINLDGGESAVHSEHSDPESFCYESNGISFLISNNNAQCRTSWVMGSCTCSINGDLTEREIKQMIDSIFTEER